MICDLSDGFFMVIHHLKRAARSSQITREGVNALVNLSQNHNVVFSALDRTYGLIDGTSHWSECLDMLVDFANISGCSLILYDCGRGQSQLIEKRGSIRQGPQSRSDIAIDDFLWRSSPGKVWSPSNTIRSSQALNFDSSPALSSNLPAEGYSVIDRDHTHILYLALFGRRPGYTLDQSTTALLDGLLPHLHRACRLQRSTKGQTLLQLAHPGETATMGSTTLPIELRLRRRFKLSKAEARVAKLLSEGLAPRTIADQLHVSIHTVRSQLQSIFQKTDTCRQAELTSLLLRETDLPAAICQQPVTTNDQERRSCL